VAAPVIVAGGRGAQLAGILISLKLYRTV